MTFTSKKLTSLVVTGLLCNKVNACQSDADCKVNEHCECPSVEEIDLTQSPAGCLKTPVTAFLTLGASLLQQASAATCAGTGVCTANDDSGSDSSSDNETDAENTSNTSTEAPTAAPTATPTTAAPTATPTATPTAAPTACVDCHITPTGGANCCTPNTNIGIYNCVDTNGAGNACCTGGGQVPNGGTTENGEPAPNSSVCCACGGRRLMDESAPKPLLESEVDMD